MDKPVTQPAHISLRSAPLMLVFSSILAAACSHGDVPPAPAPVAAASAPPATQPAPPSAANGAGCLTSGDGYFRAHLAGAIDAHIDWPNAGTRCEGESKPEPAGVRLSFHREAGSTPDLLFVFGVTGVQAGQPARAAGANLTVIVQGTSHIYGTLGDSRCTVDSLSQRPLSSPHTFRLEARGFCTQPAHAVRGDGDVLVSTFEFAGPVNYDPAPSESSAGSTAEVTTARASAPPSGSGSP